MDHPDEQAIFAQVLKIVAHWSDTGREVALDSRLDDLIQDQGAVECALDEIKESFSVDFIAFFEEGRTEQGWWIFRRTLSRNPTIRELAKHIANFGARTS